MAMDEDRDTEVTDETVQEAESMLETDATGEESREEEEEEEGCAEHQRAAADDSEGDADPDADEEKVDA